MKKPIHILLVSLLSITLLAQNNIGIKSFVKVQNDMTARIDYPKKDQNGDVCAIIKVETTQTGFSWEPDGLGIMAAVPQVGEYWLYVPYGAKRLTIKHPVLGILRDYMYPLPIEKATVYVMTLVTGKVITTVEETIESQWLVINPEPADAAVYINDVNANTGVYQNKLKPGSYIYRVEAPLYHSEVGKVEITNDKKELNVKLKPAFGYITINTEPEKDAKVIIDGKALTTNTPTKSEALASGEHTVQVMKEMYQPATKKVTVTDGQTTPISFSMQPNFAELTVTLPAEATLYINNQQKATASWTGRLNAGVYSLEARLDKHRPAKQDIELTAGDVKKVNLQPSPIYGSLDVITSPTGANITINGKEYGTTPNTIKDLLIGDYTVQLTKTGFVSLNKSVTVIEGRIIEVNEKLITGRNETIHASKTSNQNESILNNSPKNEQTWLQIIQLRLTEQDFEKARAASDLAIKAFPEFHQFYFYKGIAERHLKNYESALKANKNGLLLVNTNERNFISDYYAQFGDIYYLMDSTVLAYDAYESALSLNPNNIYVMNNYAFSLSEKKGNLKKAESLSAKTILKDNKNSLYLDTYSWIFYQQGNYSLAKFYIESAIINADPKQNNSYIYEHYGDILAKSGNEKMALEMWEKAFTSSNKTDLLKQKIENIKKTYQIEN